MRSVSRRQWAIVVVLGVVVIGLVAGWMTWNADSTETTELPDGAWASTAARASEPTIGASSHVETAVGDGGPLIEERTGKGAIAAAVRFLELTEVAVDLAPAEAAELQRSISTEESASRLAGEVESMLANVGASVPEGVAVHAAPLGAAAREVDGGWEVSIWYVEVVIYGSELAVEQWSTATYTLKWQSDEWRMAELTSIPGPTPVRPNAMVASSTAELIAATAGLSDDGWGQ